MRRLALHGYLGALPEVRALPSVAIADPSAIAFAYDAAYTHPMRIYITVLITIIIGAHIAMWASDMPRDLALRLTLINAAGWAVILLPAWGVAKWAEARTRRNDD